MQDNVVQTESGEVYTHEMLEAIDEYIRQLDDPEMIYKPMVFNGCMKYVYMQVFKPDKPQLYNSRSKLDTGDIDLLNKLWDLYTLVCAKYGHRPTVLRFSILVGISMETFDSWMKKEWRNKDDKHSESVKRWTKEAENALFDGASESNSIGAIFLLKSNFGYRETAPSPVELETRPPIDTPEQIAARHASAALQMPEKPDLD